jgi:hypothetical protein
MDTIENNIRDVTSRSGNEEYCPLGYDAVYSSIAPQKIILPKLIVFNLYFVTCINL